jgi:hypothetical protein
MNHSTTTTTSRMAKRLEYPVLAPASRLTAERENDALVAKLPNRPALILDRPWAIRSWFSFQRVPACWCSTWALEAVSRKLTSEITSTGMISALNSSQLSMPGHVRWAGRWADGPPHRRRHRHTPWPS